MGDRKRPQIYGAGLLSSIAEARHALTPAVRKRPLTAACVETNYAITRMQPQLFVAPDFEYLFDVVAQFESTLAWKRGGDYAIGEALRAGTVNHLVLSENRAVTGTVVKSMRGLRPAADDLNAAAVLLSGPVMVSVSGKAVGRPHSGPAIIAFGHGTLPAHGPFRLGLDTGLVLEGFAAGPGEVLQLRASVAGRRLGVLPTARLLLSADLPSVAGGPADPEA